MVVLVLQPLLLSESFFAVLLLLLLLADPVHLSLMLCIVVCVPWRLNIVLNTLLRHRMVSLMVSLPPASILASWSPDY